MRWALVAILTVLPAAAAADLSFREYHSHETISRTLQRWAVEQPRWVSVRSIGKSLLEREIWLVVITDHEAGEARAKPGIYVDGAHHGNEIASSEAVLYLAQHLLARVAQPEVAELLRTRAFYLVPRVNPDAAELELAGTGIRGNLKPVDDDRDGRMDEDGPEDLNGDGVIAQMRVKSPRGRWRVREGTPYLVPARPWTSGERYDLHSEGLDNDGDGRINEDPPGGVDLNRDYSPPGGDPKTPSQPESRAIAAFLDAHPNVATLQSLHTYGGVLFRPYGSLPDSKIPAADLALFDALAKDYERRTGNRAYGRPYGPGRVIYGALVDHAYGRLGIYSLTAELWRPPGPDERPRAGLMGGLEFVAGPKAEEAWRAFNDTALKGQGYLPWKPFKHPTLGEVEIGGWHPHVRRNPPPSHLEETCHEIALFILDQARATPLLAVRRAEVARAGGKTELAVEIVNSGRLPTASRQALDVGRWARDMAGVLLPDGLALAAGEERVKKVGPLAGGEVVAVRWVLEGRPAKSGARIEVVAVSEKGGVARASCTAEPGRPSTN